MKRIVLTGGGTAGHVTPNMAIIPSLREKGYDIHYIGSYDGEEKTLAKALMKELKPDVVFSKGGFVSVPVVLAASSKKIPCIIHESDMTPGLANKIAIPKADKVCCNFPETVEKLPEGKAVVTGTPIRKELFDGNSANAMSFCGFKEVRPTLLIIGGSSGSVRVNEAIWSCLDEILKTYNVIHLCGKGNLNNSLNGKKNYVQFEYIKQVLNARSFDNSGYAKLLMEEDVNDTSLLEAINYVYNNRDTYIRAMECSAKHDSVTMIVNMIEDLAK